MSTSRTGRPFPFPVEADRIAGDPGFGAGDHPLLPSMRVDQGRFAGVGPADDGDACSGASSSISSPPPSSSSVALDQGAQRLEQIGDALAMLGADRDRITEAEPKGFEDAGFGSAALGLVGDDDHRRRLDPQPAADLLVERSQALAGIDHEQGRVGLAHRGLGLLRASGQAACARPRPRSPAVSITRNSRPISLASPSRRSRVTPGRSSTSARRLPTSRLNRVDLPTLGRPTMATVGSGMGSRSSAARAPVQPYLNARQAARCRR